MLASSPTPLRECLAECGKKLPPTARLDKFFCGARCRSRAWARANTPQSLAIKEADFAAFVADLLRRSAGIKGLAGYSLGRVCPTRERAGLVWFPQPNRKTKRFPHRPGARFRFVQSAYFRLTPNVECPRVPVAGKYFLRYHREDGSEIAIPGGMAEVIVEVAFPAVRFYDKDGDYDPSGRPLKPRTKKNADKSEKDKERAHSSARTTPSQAAPQMPQKPSSQPVAPSQPQPKQGPRGKTTVGGIAKPVAGAVATRSRECSTRRDRSHFRRSVGLRFMSLARCPRSDQPPRALPPYTVFAAATHERRQLSDQSKNR